MTTIVLLPLVDGRSQFCSVAALALSPGASVHTAPTEGCATPCTTTATFTVANSRAAFVLLTVHVTVVDRDAS